MNKRINTANIILSALIESVIGWMLLALVLTLMKDVTFMQALTAPYTIGIAVSAFLGCYIGFQRKAAKKSHSLS